MSAHGLSCTRWREARRLSWLGRLLARIGGAL